jgi:hypothetical protein
MTRTGNTEKLDKLIKKYISCFKKAGLFRTRDWEVKHLLPHEISIEESFKSFRGSVNIDDTEVLWRYWGESETELHLITISFILSELNKLSTNVYSGFSVDYNRE